MGLGCGAAQLFSAHAADVLPPRHSAPNPWLQPVTNPLLYALNFVLSPRPQMQQVPCPGSWFTEGETDLLPDVLAASGGSGSSSDSSGEATLAVPLLAVCHRE